MLCLLRISRSFVKSDKTPRKSTRLWRQFDMVPKLCNYNISCALGPKKYFFPSAYTVKEVAVKQWIHFLRIKMATVRLVLLSELDPFSTVTFEKSRRAAQWSYFITIQVSKWLNSKLISFKYGKRSVQGLQGLSHTKKWTHDTPSNCYHFQLF